MKNGRQRSSIKRKTKALKQNSSRTGVLILFWKAGLENAKKAKKTTKKPHYFPQTIVYNLISFTALSNFNNSQHSVFTTSLMKNCLSFVSFSFLRFQIAISFTLNNETTRNILFLWRPEIPQCLHTTPKYLKLSTIEDDSTAIRLISNFFESYARHEQNYWKKIDSRANAAL